MRAATATAVKTASTLETAAAKAATPFVSPAAAAYIDRENQFSAHNYHPIPVVLKRGQGVHVWDVNDKRYLDFLSSYSTVNQGHCHPRLVKVMQEQCARLTLTSRAFHSNLFGEFAQKLTEYAGFDRMLPMNTGAEAVESSVKIARKWGYQVKGIPENQAIVLFASNNFHGRTMVAVSASTDPSCYTGFGPFMPNIRTIPFNDIDALEEEIIKQEGKVVSFIVEPIQGEAGVIVPRAGYMKMAYEVCKRHNVLLVADEIQTGMARTGRRFAVDHDLVKPDMLLLGKALSGGMMPVSAVLASNEVMDVLTPGTHGSTFGGNPLASAVAMEAIKIIEDEKLDERAARMGERLRDGLMNIAKEEPSIKVVRGRGLLNAVVIDAEDKTWNAQEASHALAASGLLCKPTRGDTLRLAPPLIITEEQVDEALSIFRNVLVNKPRVDMGKYH